MGSMWSVIGVEKPYSKVKDRGSGKEVFEKVPADLRFLLAFHFGTSPGRFITRLTPYKWFCQASSKLKGWLFSHPRSKKQIATFVEKWGVNVAEAELPIEEYNTLNEFFCRRLKRGCRPIAGYDNPLTVVSPSDCRITLFRNVDEAQELWVKGRKFSIAALLDDSSLAHKYHHGAMALCRLAPNDYHRFHCPVGPCVIGDITCIGDHLHTVKDYAVRSPIDVLTENKRIVIALDTAEYGRVLLLAIGAMYVGSIQHNLEVGQTLQKGDEMGWFEYGGSTILLLFQEGMMTVEADLMENTRLGFETLIKMGEAIGTGTNK